MSRPLAVHRCRFVDYAPSPITALAFPPLPLPSLKGKKRERDLKDNKFGTLGVGHANGNIDLLEWTAEEGEIQAPQAWQVRKVSTLRCYLIQQLKSHLDSSRSMPVKSRFASFYSTLSRHISIRKHTFVL